jgi:uncharacterized delta-60 repeat protein
MLPPLRSVIAQCVAGVLLLSPLPKLQAAPGDLDTSFQSSRGASDTVQCIVEEPDGKLLIGGEFSAADDIPRSRIARLNADGTVDRWFLSGLSGADGQVRVMLREPDGRILLGGAFRNINGVPRAHIARLLPDGTLDDSFLRGWSGVGDTLFGIYNIVRQTDGKILIGGSFRLANGTPRGGIARLHPDGSLDSSFMHGLAGADSTVRRVALLPDDRIVIAGSFDTVNGLPRRGVARLHNDGKVDESFQSSLDDGSFQVRALGLQPDGKVLLGGFGIRIGGVAMGAVTRLNSDGSEDTAFNSSAIGGEARTILLQEDGKVVSAGMRGSPSQGFVERSNPDGSRDPDFKYSWYLPEAGNSSSSVQCIYLRGDGSFTAGGDFTRHDSSGVSGFSCNRLVRLRDNGQADPAFITALSGISGPVQCLQEQAGTGGKILVGGGFSGGPSFDNRSARKIERRRHAGCRLCQSAAARYSIQSLLCPGSRRRYRLCRRGQIQFGSGKFPPQYRPLQCRRRTGWRISAGESGNHDADIRPGPAAGW